MKLSPKLAPLRLDNYKPLRDVVFETLREAIIDGLVGPGERLMEVNLAEELGVSRTPVREAIRKLELEGFVVMVPRKGAYVADLTNKDIADVFEIRGALESLAAGLAAERITDEELEELELLLLEVAEKAEKNDIEGVVDADTRFHDVLYKASRNNRLVLIVSNLREQIQMFRVTSLSSPGRMPETIAEHRRIVDAIADRNVAQAQSLAQDHLDNAENRLLEAVTSSFTSQVKGQLQEASEVEE